ncbi:MAG: hypothetical protein ACF8PN_08520 [Phycisphaerales bacterium]
MNESRIVWHAAGDDFHHSNTRCEAGQVAASRDVQWVHGGLPKCPRCAELDRRHRQVNATERRLAPGYTRVSTN